MRKKRKFLFVFLLLLFFIPGMFLLGCDEEAPSGQDTMDDPVMEDPIIVE